MVETVSSLEEKDCIRRMSGELIAEVLWNPGVSEAHGETTAHDICVKRNGGCVEAIVSSKA